MKSYFLIALFLISTSNAVFSKSDGDLYYEEYDFNGKTITIKELSDDEYIIKFPIDNIYMEKKGGLGGLGLSNTWLTDFDNDKNPEISLFWKDAGTGAYANFYFYELTTNGLQKKEFPKINKAVKKYYRGKDYFKVTKLEIIHEFPAYNEHDPNANATAGTVKIYYNYSNDMIKETGYKLIQPSEDMNNNLEKPTLKIVQITGLAKYDRFSQADAFVEIHVGDKLIGKTKRVKDSASPVFNESFIISETDKSNLIFKVFDKDMTKNEFIGELNLVELKSGTYPIMNEKKDGSIQKVAEIQIEYIED